MLTVEVSRKAAVAAGVYLFELQAIDGAPLPAYAAGAHIDVEIRPGLTRQYSLCGPTDRPDAYHIAVLREPASRGGSIAMAETIRQGDRLRIGAPRNLFALAPDQTAARLVAGGIGITPILAMARELTDRGVPFKLWYGGRSRSSMAFHGDILGGPFSAQATLHADDEASAGLDLAAALEAPQPGEHLYVCGPAGLIAATLSMAASAGWPEGSAHRESFASTAPNDGDAAFTLVLAKSGLRLEVPADRTALEVLVENGVEIDSSCEQGVCGTCMTGVLAGEPDHRDQYLTDDEKAANSCFTPCCSRARSSELVLDL